MLEKLPRSKSYRTQVPRASTIFTMGKKIGTKKECDLVHELMENHPELRRRNKQFILLKQNFRNLIFRC